MLSLTRRGRGGTHWSPFIFGTMLLIILHPLFHQRGEVLFESFGFLVVDAQPLSSYSVGASVNSMLKMNRSDNIRSQDAGKLVEDVSRIEYVDGQSTVDPDPVGVSTCVTKGRVNIHPREHRGYVSYSHNGRPTKRRLVVRQMIGIKVPSIGYAVHSTQSSIRAALEQRPLMNTHHPSQASYPQRR
jgi:hypothetical protein